MAFKEMLPSELRFDQKKVAVKQEVKTENVTSHSKSNLSLFSYGLTDLLNKIAEKRYN